MGISKKELYRTKLTSIKSIIENVNEKQKQGLVGDGLAKDFNKLLENIGDTFQDLKDELPPPITFNSPYSKMGMADCNYLDLEINTEIVLNLLNLLK